MGIFKMDADQFQWINGTEDVSGMNGISAETSKRMPGF